MTKHLKYFSPVLLFAGLCLFFTGCGKNVSTTTENTENAAVLSETESLPEEPVVSLTKSQLATYGTVHSCTINEDKEYVEMSLSLPQIPASDDDLIYLYAFEIYESEHDFHKVPIMRTEKATDCTITWPYADGHLYQEFVPTVLLHEEYVPIATGSYITNPEMLAENQLPFPEKESKKGLLLDPAMLTSEKLTDLDVKYALYNIPLSMLMGETTDPTFPTVEYGFRGRTYYFNGATVSFYDTLFNYLTSMGMTTTAIILNDWDEDYTEMIHPLAREQKKGAYYYALNTAEEEGCRRVEAAASFLASRYASGEHGTVSGWVIANEINQHRIWNYMDTDDVSYYGAEFEKSMRIFYNAIKSRSANARIYFSVDHAWNTNDGSESDYFNAKDVVKAINDAACAKGNYDWGLALHPYPDPLTRVNYWTGEYDKTIDSPLLTVMNLNVVTDFLCQEEYLDREGNVRNMTITELGFSSATGEKLQAAAFAYCYYIVDANPYINAFMMNRQTDAWEELRQGLAFGIYDTDQDPKYIYDVFKYIDTDQASEYTDFMLKILDAESLEEALSWAQ